jgi:hypothetical protein
MEESTRIVKLSVDILAEMFRQNRRLNCRILKGLPDGARIVAVQLDPIGPHVSLTVRGHFSEGNDGELFDITVQDIHENA